MSTLALQAAPHTYLIKDTPANYEFIPVVGWLILGATQWAQPIFSKPSVQVHRRDCILHWDHHDPQQPDGSCVHPHTGQIFENFAEWKTYIESVPASSDDGKAVEHPAADISRRMANDPDIGRKAVEQIFNSTGDMPADQKELDDSKPLAFGAASYKSKSFWKWPSSKVIFEIDANQVYPADKRVEKIKRDEFFTLRRDGWPTVNPHDGTIADIGSEPEQTAAAAFDPSDLI